MYQFIYYFDLIYYKGPNKIGARCLMYIYYNMYMLRAKLQMFGMRHTWAKLKNNKTL